MRLEIENQLGLAGPISQTEVVVSEEITPEALSSDQPPELLSYRTPEFLRFWKAHCESLMRNPPKSGGT